MFSWTADNEILHPGSPVIGGCGDGFDVSECGARGAAYNHQVQKTSARTASINIRDEISSYAAIGPVRHSPVRWPPGLVVLLTRESKRLTTPMMTRELNVSIRLAGLGKKSVYALPHRQ